MKSLLIYPLAALAEIAGCFAFWAWLKLDRSPLWLIPGAAALVAFALFLALVPAGAAGRAFAAYGGGLYRRVAGLDGAGGEDLAGSVGPRRGLVCLAGAAMILFGPRESGQSVAQNSGTTSVAGP